MKKIKILLVGYLPPPTGGVRVLFRQLALELKQTDDAEIAIISLTGKARSAPWKLASLCWGMLRALIQCFRVDVVTLHPTNQALAIAGPLLFLACRLLGKPFVVRKFGGSFHETVRSYPAIIRTILKATVFKADLWLLETHFLVDHFKNYFRHVAYYPNNRPELKRSTPASARAKRFVFISHIRVGKGAIELFEISDHLPPGCRIDIYGQPGFDIPESQIMKLASLHSAHYKGPVPFEKVPEILQRYDVLVLPTRLQTEGYPGIILEAYSCGMPVIASNCGAIGEIVDLQSGLLVEPGNRQQLQQAIIKIHNDDSLFHQLQEGAIKKAAQFSSHFWTGEFLRFCKELHEKNNVGQSG